MEESREEPLAPDSGATNQELRSGAVCVRPATRELLVDGDPVAIERRAFDLLVHLMRHPDRVVDKDELLRDVWHSRPITESTLQQAVSRVRRALGGDADEWIATVYGVGYRFAAPVTVVDPAGASVDAEPPPGADGESSRGVFLRRPVWTLLLAVGLVAALIVAGVRVLQPPAMELQVAVLPVSNETLDAQLDWVELGVLPLIDQALEAGGARAVPASRVVSTLRQYPEAEDSESRARVLRLNARVDRVLVPRLYRADDGFRLELSRLDGVDSTESIELQGDDIAVLAVAAGAEATRSLARASAREPARQRLVTDDPFVNEAFMRGLDARLRGQWEAAARYFDTVLASVPGLLSAKLQLAQVTRQLGDWDYADQLHQELQQAAEEAGDRAMIAAALSASGTLAWRRGDAEAAEDRYRRALEIYREIDRTDRLAAMAVNLGILAASRSDFELGEQRMREALVHYRAAGDRFNVARTLKNIGNLLGDQGRYAEAEEVLLESLEIRQTLELPLQVALTLSNLGDVEMARGNYEQVLAYQRRVLEAAAEDSDSPLLAIQARSDLSAALRRLGRLEEAVAMAADAYARATELGAPSNQAFSLLQQGRAESSRDRNARAATLFERAALLYAEIDQPLGEANARIARAGALVAGDRIDAAAAELAAARAWLDASGVGRLDIPMARAEAQLALARGEADRAVERLAAALEAARGAQMPIDVLDLSGEYGLALLQYPDGAERAAALAVEVGANADIDVSAAALRFLTRYHAPEAPGPALEWAERRRAVLGEGWTPEDERELQALRVRAAESP